MTFHEQLARATAADREFLLSAPVIQRALAGDVTRGQHHEGQMDIDHADDDRQRAVHQGHRPQADKTERARQDVIYCPTDQWHRLVELGGATNLIGYQYLPGRVPGWLYNSDGLGEWTFPKKLGGPITRPPS